MAEEKRNFNGIPRDFYYGNTYPNDQDKATRMGGKVFYDLKPFSEYLRKSRESLERAAKIKAECFEVKQRLIAKPLFSIIRVNADSTVTVAVPQGNYYILDWNDEWGGVDLFDALAKGRKQVFDNDDIVDVSTKHIVFCSDEELDTDGAFQVWLSEAEDSIKCNISKLDFTSIDEYSIASGNVKFISASYNGKALALQYTGVLTEEVEFFSRKKQVVKSQSTKVHDISKMRLTMDGTKIKHLKDNLAVASCDDNLLGRLYADGIEFKYEVFGKEDICDFLNDKRIRFFDRKIEVVESSLGDSGDKIEISNLPFEIVNLGQNIRRRFKDNTGNAISKIIEIVEDEDFKDDVYSNVSYFFRETTETLTSTDGRRFRIGNKFENFNQLEICEFNGKDNVVITDLPKELYIEPNARQIRMQQNALRVLLDKPCIEHAPLLELMQERRFCEWGFCDYESEHIRKWYRLTNIKYEGCDSQREFVKKALATPDFAILEGPPGSGKTTTILEIIAQMIMRGEKVMLAASTNAAIDNILERLTDLPNEVQEKILAVRIGNESAISDSVGQYTLFDMDKYLRNEIISRANLVCGTIIGVLQHPEFNLGDTKLPVRPLYDCLIIDEASKTTFQEFLVPAIYARKWILSGDLKQLTPYVEQDNIEASLSQIKAFDISHQKAQAILMCLENDVYKSGKDKEVLRKLRFCIAVDADTLRAIAELIPDYPYRKIALLGNIDGSNAATIEEFMNSPEKAVMVYGSDLLFVDRKDYATISKYIPSDFIPLLGGYGIADYQAAASHKALTTFAYKNLEKLKSYLTSELKEKSWAGEIAWRLCRVQELFLLSEIGDGTDDMTDKYLKQIDERIPEFAAVDVQREIALLREIALPSIIQLLQKGIGEKSIIENTKQTTLNRGFDAGVLATRHTLVEYQHRMHNDISAFPAQHIYKGIALKNGKTIKRDWDYGRYSNRAQWLEVPTNEKCQNKNVFEVEKIAEEIKAFIEFAIANPRPDGSPWSIACLTYYRAQETELKNKIQRLLREERPRSYYNKPDKNIEVMIYTVDKFQGKEADIVFLSMIKAGEVNLGFMDSPNRLNVALTRAKFQLVLVGNKKYFKSNRCKSKLLQSVAEDY